MSYQQKKRQGGYYNQRNQKKKREFILEPGIKGFICTCNSREKDCVREAFNILNDYADQLYGDEGRNDSLKRKSPEISEGNTIEGKEVEEDIDEAFSREIAELKRNPRKEWRFHVVESGANNCVFIKTTLPDPTELAHYIMKDIDNTKKQRSRFLLRLVPVEVTCKAYMDEIKKSAAPLFDKYFSKEGKSFAIAFNHRNNNSLKRNEVIEQLAEMVTSRNPDNKVNLTQPDLTIIVEVIRAMCCVSVVPDYFKLLKYNMLELCGKGEKAAQELKKEDVAEGDSNEISKQTEHPTGDTTEEEHNLVEDEKTEIHECV